jgi:hypothetical protein
MLSEEFDSILQKYKRQKLNTYKVLELLGNDYLFKDYGADTDDKRYTQLLNCGTQLFFTKDFDNGHSVYHLTGANFCRQRVCPMCQFRRSERMFVQMLSVVKALEGEYRFLHLVLTIPNAQSDLQLIAGIKILYKAFNMMLRRKAFKNAFKGALRCLEVSFNYNNDTFHPHLHCLIAVRPSYFNDTKVYLSRDRIMQEWTDCVNKTIPTIDNSDFAVSDYPLQIYVRACKVGDYKGVAEVCKYCLKPLDTSKATDLQQRHVLITLWLTLKNQRFVQKYGVIKDTFKRLFDNEAEDLTEETNQKTGEGDSLFLFWDSSTMNYKY